MKVIAIVSVAIGLVSILAFMFTVQSAKASPLQEELRLEEVANTLFAKNCATCHGQDDRARTVKAKINHARNLSDPEWQAVITDEHIYESILKGNHRMPAFERKLSKSEIAALVTYIRMLKK